MADKHWVKDLNGDTVIVLDFLGTTNVRVRIGDSIDTEIWPIDFWRSLPFAKTDA